MSAALQAVKNQIELLGYECIEYNGHADFVIAQHSSLYNMTFGELNQGLLIQARFRSKKKDASDLERSDAVNQANANSVVPRARWYYGESGEAILLVEYYFQIPFDVERFTTLIYLFNEDVARILGSDRVTELFE